MTDRDELGNEYYELIGPTLSTTTTIEATNGHPVAEPAPVAHEPADAPNGKGVSESYTDVPPPSDTAPAIFVHELTEDANASAFAAEIAGRWRFVPQTRRWYQADGHLWIPDDSGKIIEEARAVFRRLSCGEH